MQYLYFFLVALVSYLIGTINFAKILSWNVKHKDITKVGSGNPGTMNMLRSFGFAMALVAFLAEVVKAGVVCFVARLILPEYGSLIYFFAGIFVILGQNFPVWSKFKGGKGVACFAGVFLFSQIWYVALAWFVVCFILFLFVEYACVISLTYLTGNAIALTVYVWVTGDPFALAVTIIVWMLILLTVIRHRSNIKRLWNHTENKINFRQKLTQAFKKKKGEEIISEEILEHKPEQEIVIEKDQTDGQKTESQNDQTVSQNTENQEGQSEEKEGK